MLTDRRIRSLTTGRYGDGRGLWLRVYPSGAKSWYTRRKVNGKDVTKVIGEYPVVSLKQARAKATTIKIEAGRAPFFRAIAEDWLDDFAKHRRRPDVPAKLIYGLLIPAFGDKRVDELSRKDVVAWFRTYQQQAPARSFKAGSVMGQILRHAVILGHIEISPLAGVPLGTLGEQGKSDGRLPTKEELVRLVSDAEHDDRAVVVLLCALTAMRIGEVLAITGKDVEAGALILPQTKNGRRHHVPLVGMAADLINTRITEDRLFPQSYSTIISWMGKAGYTARPHDYRRWHATTLGELGCLPHIIDAQLNHRPPGMRGVYNKAVYWEERVKYSRAVSEKIRDLNEVSSSEEGETLRASEESK